MFGCSYLALLCFFIVACSLSEQTDITCPPADGPLPVYVRSAESCSKFYQCSNGVALLHVCPDTLLFNTELNVCDYPWNVDCCDEPNGDDSSDGNDTPSSEAPATRSTAVPDVTPSERSNLTSTTVSPDNSDDGNEDNNDDNGDQNNDDNNNSNQNDDDDNEDNNDSNQNDDGNNSNGNEDNDDGNNSNGNEDDNDDGNNSNGNEDDNDDGNNSNGNEDDNDESSVTEDPSDDITAVCSQSPDGFFLYPNPDDCASYISCNFGNAVIMPCPTGLHFNPYIHVCVQPEDAYCKLRA